VNKLARGRLYAILDLGYVEPGRAETVARELIRGGADLIQLRGKKQSQAELICLAERLHCLTRAAGVPLIINDHPEIAREVALEGLHLGQDDLAIDAAREIVKRDCWFGKSPQPGPATAAVVAPTHRYGRLRHADEADYQPIGTDDIRRVHGLVRLPIFCIGGIKLHNLPAVLAAGAERAVIVSGLLRSGDVAAATRAAKQLLVENQKSEIKDQK
jgi:thiamine-phosphate pyrophosphorylase